MVFLKITIYSDLKDLKHDIKNHLGYLKKIIEQDRKEDYIEEKGTSFSSCYNIGLEKNTNRKKAGNAS